jgi:hypothetical protein
MEEVDQLVSDYLAGKSSLDEAVARIQERTKSEPKILSYILSVVLPEDMYLRRIDELTRRSWGNSGNNRAAKEVAA